VVPADNYVPTVVYVPLCRNTQVSFNCSKSFNNLPYAILATKIYLYRPKLQNLHRILKVGTLDRSIYGPKVAKNLGT
jgi:hypothetical protein